MPHNDLEVIDEVLSSQTTLSLATAGEDGAVAIAPLFYFPAEGPRVYWFSSRRSEHSRNLRRNSSAAVAVFQPTDQWKRIRGVQMKGAVSIVTSRTCRAEIARGYAERFHLGDLFKPAMARSSLYVFEPRWMRLVDNSRRFGYKSEFQAPFSTA